jgi:hypothetical protein
MWQHAAMSYASNKGPRIPFNRAGRTPEENKATWEEMHLVFANPPPRTGQCGMSGCENPVHCTGVCKQHYNSYHYLCKKMGVEKREDLRYTRETPPKEPTLAKGEWELRQQAAQMGIPPGALAIARGLQW